MSRIMENIEAVNESMNNIEIAENRFNPISLPTSEVDSVGKKISSQEF